MKIFISPAKSISFSEPKNKSISSIPQFEKETMQLMGKLQKMSSKKIGALMHVSDDLAALNFERFQNFQFPKFQNESVNASLFSFSGEVYKGFDSDSLEVSQYENVQNQVRILSGLYGVLKPFDLFFPYRLEMGTSWKITPKMPNLVAFWKAKLTQNLKSELAIDELIINLASLEYNKAIDFKSIKNTTITPVFKEYKNGKHTIVMMYAKHARGKMARYLIENPTENSEDLKKYNVDGYLFEDSLSSPSEFVFTR